ncbi:hypothetical protein MTR67_050047 [Solanum verrucosum]|uniref:Uncharacterized protein n=1 Tax=Solanum verrucosum TaxID=315347 RepID=A0AAF0V1M1_SOLVR|nr:hypothetical protein MTR67_050047 [Solanum verrucosum]
MADSTALKRQNLDGIVSETPSSQKYETFVTPTLVEDRKNGFDPLLLSREKSKNGSGSSLSSSEKKIDNLAKDFDYRSLTPNDKGYTEFHYGELEDCGGVNEILPDGASKEQHLDFVKLFRAYDRQMFNSKVYKYKALKVEKANYELTS